MSAIFEWVSDGTVGALAPRVGPLPATLGRGHFQVRIDFIGRPGANIWLPAAGMTNLLVWNGNNVTLDEAERAADYYAGKWWAATWAPATWWPKGLAFPLPHDVCVQVRIDQAAGKVGSARTVKAFVRCYEPPLAMRRAALAGIGDAGTLGTPPMPAPYHPPGWEVATAEIDTINQTYYELTVYLNGLISQLAKNYDVAKQQVFDVMKSRVPIGLPWCTHRTANPGDSAPNCGVPPMQPGAPPCCLQWWPDDCSFAGITELPYRPRPPCSSVIIKWTNTYALDVGAYQTGMQAYANWKLDLQNKLDAIKAELKKMKPAGPQPEGRQAPRPGEPDENAPKPGEPGGGGPPPASVSPEIVAAIRALMNDYRKHGSDACMIERTVVRAAQRAVNAPVTGVYDAATAERVKAFDSFAPSACAVSGEGESPSTGETKRPNAGWYVAGAVAVAGGLYFLLK